MKKWSSPELAEVKISETACFDWNNKWWEPTYPTKPTYPSKPTPPTKPTFPTCPTPGPGEEDILS